MAESKTQTSAQESKVALASAPIPTEPVFTESDEVTVLYGYGRVHPDAVNIVDGVTFKGGIAHNVPYAQAKHWKQHTRPDGRLPASRIQIQAILPVDATQADYVRATGISPMQPEKVAAMMNAMNPDDIIAALGRTGSRDLALALNNRLGIVTK